MTENANNDQTLLLILPLKKEIYPLSPAALTQAQAPRRQLASDYQNALILYRDGTLRRVEHIEILGPWGESITRKLFSRLTDAWNIAVRLSDPLPWQFEELKQLVAECINIHGDMGFPELYEPSTKQQIIRAILAASNAKHIFDILKVPPPNEALDVL